MPFFVYYFDCGVVAGLKECATVAEAQAFIEAHMEKTKGVPEDYIVIQGARKTVTTVEKAVKVHIE